jgi:hypothetical protein
MMIDQNEDHGGCGENWMGAGGDGEFGTLPRMKGTAGTSGLVVSFHTQLQEQSMMMAKLREEMETRYGNMQQQLSDISSTMHLILSKMSCTTSPNQITPAGCSDDFKEISLTSDEKTAAVSTQHNRHKVKKVVQQKQVTKPLDETLVTGTLCFPGDWFHSGKDFHPDKSMNE